MTVATLTEEQSQYIQAFDILDEVQPYRHIYKFVKNDMKMGRADFIEVQTAIKNIMMDLGVNFGILLMTEGTYVFTEQKIKLDALVVKLATGINYEKGVQNAGGVLNTANQYVVRKETA